MNEYVERLKRSSVGVPILPIEELRRLPDAEDYDSGLYFLWIGDELRYVGKSENLKGRKQRRVQMNRVNGWIRNRPIQFDRYTCLILHSSPYIENRGEFEGMLKRYERAYIAHYQPPDNLLYATPNT